VEVVNEAIPLTSVEVTMFLPESINVTEPTGVP
jgi:hypothetical protein